MKGSIAGQEQSASGVPFAASGVGTCKGTHPLLQASLAAYAKGSSSLCVLADKDALVGHNPQARSNRLGTKEAKHAALNLLKDL